jgi:organic hydroperoxide reductase OsmC/OhrA
MATARYETQVRWTGSTGLGWDHYDRTHSASATGESKGDPSLLNPELLLLMAASSCQMLWFLHLAAKARVDVVEYRDDAIALMPTDQEPVRISEIELRPHIAVAGEASEERIRKLVDTAHEHCFVANSLTSELTLHPTLEVRT